MTEIIPPSTYEIWRDQEGVPVHKGPMFSDLYGPIVMSMWKRKGVPGAFIDLDGGEESLDAYVIEIPPGGETLPEKYMFEEEVTVLSGYGVAVVSTTSGSKQTFEWQPGSLFSPPLNTNRQYYNSSATEPARLLVVSNAPIVWNYFRSENFVYNCDHEFTERFSGESDFFSGEGTDLGGMVWQTNFVKDINNFHLRDYSDRGAGGTGVMFEMANNTMQSHIAEFPVGTYKKAHRHGPAAHILILSGDGYTLMWKDDPKDAIRIDWKPGALFSPPDMWWHQQFNLGEEPARYFAVHYGYWRVVMKDLGPEKVHEEHGLQISYEGEDPLVLQTFQEGLSDRGLDPLPLDDWRRD